MNIEPFKYFLEKVLSLNDFLERTSSMGKSSRENIEWYCKYKIEQYMLEYQGAIKSKSISIID